MSSGTGSQRVTRRQGWGIKKARTVGVGADHTGLLIPGCRYSTLFLEKAFKEESEVFRVVLQEEDESGMVGERWGSIVT